MFNLKARKLSSCDLSMKQLAVYLHELCPLNPCTGHVLRSSASYTSSRGGPLEHPMGHGGTMIDGAPNLVEIIHDFSGLAHSLGLFHGATHGLHFLDDHDKRIS